MHATFAHRRTRTVGSRLEHVPFERASPTAERAQGRVPGAPIVQQPRQFSRPAASAQYDPASVADSLARKPLPDPLVSGRPEM